MRDGAGHCASSVLALLDHFSGSRETLSRLTVAAMSSAARYGNLKYLQELYWSRYDIALPGDRGYNYETREYLDRDWLAVMRSAVAGRDPETCRWVWEIANSPTETGIWNGGNGACEPLDLSLCGPDAADLIAAAPMEDAADD